MEYSPGPWEEKITDDGLAWVLMPDGHRVSIGDMEETCGICHANARLIKAAPDLLEALQIVPIPPNVGDFTYRNAIDVWLKDADEWYRQTRELIAQATEME